MYTFIKVSKSCDSVTYGVRSLQEVKAGGADRRSRQEVQTVGPGRRWSGTCRRSRAEILAGCAGGKSRAEVQLGRWLSCYWPLPRGEQPS